MDKIASGELVLDNSNRESEKMPLDETAIPCGLVAKSFFNDTFVLKKKGNANSVTILKDDIAWSSDVTYKFKNTKEKDLKSGQKWQDIQWIDMTNRQSNYSYSYSHFYILYYSFYSLVLLFLILNYYRNLFPGFLTLFFLIIS